MPVLHALIVGIKNVKSTENSISEGIDLKIFLGSMPQTPQEARAFQGARDTCLVCSESLATALNCLSRAT